MCRIFNNVEQGRMEIGNVYFKFSQISAKIIYKFNFLIFKLRFNFFGYFFDKIPDIDPF